MASNAAGDVVVLNNNLDRATTCRSRLPRPGRRRSQQLTRSQVTSPVACNNNNTPTRLKFPQLEMTKRSHCSASSSKIPLPDLTLKTNLNSSAEWLKERPKTSIDLITSSAKFKKNLPTSSTHQKKIQELIARRNSSEDQTRFPRFPTLPAIGPSQVTTWESETFDLIQSQEPRVMYCDSESKMSSKIENTKSDLNCEEKPDTAQSEPIRLEQNEITMDLEAAARPLIRSDTYDILPTLNEEDCDNSNDFETEIEDSNKDNILSIFDTTSTASDQSDNENLEEKSSTD